MEKLEDLIERFCTEEDIDLGSIDRPGNGAIFVTLEWFRGKPALDIREYFLPDGEEEMRPTKKGVKITTSKVGEFAAMVLTAAKIIEGVEDDES